MLHQQLYMYMEKCFVSNAKILGYDYIVLQNAGIPMKLQIHTLYIHVYTCSSINCEDVMSLKDLINFKIFQLFLKPYMHCY